jgi:hypothetical protein
MTVPGEFPTRETKELLYFVSGYHAEARRVMYSCEGGRDGRVVDAVVVKNGSADFANSQIPS